jgi:polyisoprenoid-binding protein YceI
MSALANFLLSLIGAFLFTFQSSTEAIAADSPLRRWTLLDSATLIDAQSQLTWTRSDNGHDIDWHHARKFCNDLPGKWRLPTAAELVSIYDGAAVGTKCGDARCGVSGPFELTGDWFWSADAVGNDGSDGAELAWGVLLVNGSRTKSVQDAGEDGRALCVRQSTRSPSTGPMRPALPDDRASVVLPIDASHTAIIFSWTHRGFSHPLARLERLNGTVVWDRTDLAASSVLVTMPLDGLRTGDDALDKRLRGRDFFDVASYPMITFKSTKIIPKETTDQFTLIGELTVHGVTRPVTLLGKINKIEDAPGRAPWTGFDAE